MTATVDASSATRATDLSTRREIAATYFANGSPRVITAAVAALAIVRVVVGGWHLADLAMIATTVVLVGTVEWFIHLFLLHAPEDSFRMRVLKTGTGHREHHLDPPRLDHLLLAPLDASVFLVMLAGWTAVWAVPLAWLLGGPVLTPYLTALLSAWVALAHYEWTHLFVHTAYRPKNRYYARLARNHRLHHYRNEHYWLGVTANSGDRLLRTLPRQKTDVPLSDTARTLDG